MTDTSEIFKNSLEQQLNALKLKKEVVARNLRNINEYPSGRDVDLIQDSEKKMIELKLEELALGIEHEKINIEVLKSHLVRGGQIHILEQTRENLNSFLHLMEKGNTSLSVSEGADECVEILRKFNKTNDIVTQKEDGADAYGLFHVTTKDIKTSLEKTNVLDVMRNAKKNGWDLRLQDDKIEIYKNGKKLNDHDKKKLFVFHTASKTEKIKKETKTCKKNLKKNIPER